MGKWEDTTFGKVLIPFFREFKGEQGETPWEWVLNTNENVYEVMLAFGIEQGLVQTDNYKGCRAFVVVVGGALLGVGLLSTFLPAFSLVSFILE